jgi:predicted PurR-regulated permease PerM
MVIVQQIENIFLVPRILGGALELHPLIVIVGVLMGASIAGILGAVLAAPVIASLRLFGRYAWRKLFDLHPFPDTPKPEDSSTTFGLIVLYERGRAWLTHLRPPN